MKSKNRISDRNGTPVEIKPLSFRPGHYKKRPKSSKILIGTLCLGLGAFLVLLGASAWFLFTARRVVIRIDPEPDQVSFQGAMVTPKVGDYYLMRPGFYVLEAVKSCYQPLKQEMAVAGEKNQDFKFSMTRQPGRLSIQAHQADVPADLIAGARILIDGQDHGVTPLTGAEVAPGRRSIDIQAENYQALHTDIEIAGCGKEQQFNLALVPAWADITLQSKPPGASVFANHKLVGKTPLTLKLLEGNHDLRIEADRFKSWHTRLAVAANQPQKLATIHLQPADGRLAIQTKPAGATVMIGKHYAGQTPLKLALTPDETHRIQVSKAGFKKAEHTVKLASDESKTLSITLKPKYGVINFVVIPDDANLFVDGRPMGRVPATLRLVAIEHQLEIKKQGYRTYQTRITPRPGFPQEINISLTHLSPRPATPAGIIRAKNGYELKLVRPGTFTMGSSRREQGRRSNETLRKIKLQRPFYLGIREVTNKEFRQFLTDHNSGAFKAESLDLDQLPVVQITWLQAALFCNWLSARESLPLVYEQKGGRFTVTEPVGVGYRLPTEAEWEYCARFNQKRADLKYPWGKNYPPSAKSGNFADVSAKNLLANYLATYNDGYAVSAPPAKFKINALGIFDLGGNVSEWCHDYYSIQPYRDGKVWVDPTGPTEGRYHVIKGSSWMQAGISELRLAYRDYSDTKRLDLGFRIARYLK